MSASLAHPPLLFLLSDDQMMIKLRSALITAQADETAIDAANARQLKRVWQNMNDEG